MRYCGTLVFRSRLGLLVPVASALVGRSTITLSWRVCTPATR
jgi:hypothetical protein